MASDHDELVNILLIEDNPGDALLVRESMRDLKLRNRLHHVSDGDEAMRFLLRQDEYAAAVRPDAMRCPVSG